MQSSLFQEPSLGHPVIKSAVSPEVLHQKAFNNSLQPNMILNVADSSILSANRAACKLLGYSKKELLTRNGTDIFMPGEASYKKMMMRRKSDGHVKADVTMIKKSGKKFLCEVTSVTFNNASSSGNSIVSIVDLSKRNTEQQKLDIKNEKIVAGNIVIAQSKADLRQSGDNEWMTSVAKTTYDLIWDWDMTTNLIYFGQNYSSIFGNKLPKNRISFKEWINLFKAEEKSVIKEKIQVALTTDKKKWQISYAFTRADGTVAEVNCRANVLRSSSGKITRIIGVMQDTGKEQRLEEALEREIRIKEKQIIEAIVEAREAERSDIGKELHDNINQLLGASVLYLDMARENVDNADIYLTHSLDYTRTAIEEIRKISKGLTTDVIKDFGLCGAIQKMSLDIMLAYPIMIHCIIDESLEDKLSDKFRLNAFRILQEQLNNIIKHAFAAEVYIRLSQTDTGFILLSISDDGKGFDTTKKTKGIGLSNIVSRAKLYQGDASFISQTGKGCMLAVNFPIVSAQ